MILLSELLRSPEDTSGLEVIKLELIFRLKRKPNDWLLADTCPQDGCIRDFAFRIVEDTSGLEVIKLEFIFRLKLKPNDWLLADTCPQDRCIRDFAFRIVEKTHLAPRL